MVTQKRKIRQFDAQVFPVVHLSGCADLKDRSCGSTMVPRSPLDDPETAAFAWARYRRLMRWMMLVTVTLVAGSMYLLYRSNGFVSVHFYIATALGIGFAMLLMSALMGLVFLSNGTGHDDAIIDPLEDEHER